MKTGAARRTTLIEMVKLGKVKGGKNNVRNDSFVEIRYYSY